ncbi:MAG: YeeE/YedE thiosulfate transporter family protein [Pseudomonadota bacterium]|nr:YeeE/YedE thiosulfate transporter family protein [Pseudomonadota bacterium]
MTDFTPYSALIGGALIGLTSAFLLFGLGRVLGISGFVHGLIARDSQFGWRASFLIGLLLAGVIAAFVTEVPYRIVTMPWVQVLAAGLLVGYGTKMGSGCTSGHGVCGLGRRSMRSVVAVCTFMATAIITVYLVRHVF